jgi:hypothetical protein
MEKSTLNKNSLSKNIGKKCKVTSSAIVGLIGRIGTIKSVQGNDIDGYRYEIHLEKPLYDFTTKLDFFPPTFFCEIL